MKFALRAATPIHVGNGERLAWLDWFVEQRTMHAVDWGALLDAALVRHDDAAERLAEFADAGAAAIEAARDEVQKARGRERQEALDRLRQKTSPVRFAADQLRDAELAQRLRDGAFDRWRAAFAGGRFDRRLEIRTQAKDAAGRPTVPGSTLKGQIRSALAQMVLSRGDEDLARVVLEGAGGAGGPGGPGGWTRDFARATPLRARFLFGADLEAAVFRAAGATGPATPRRNAPLPDDPRRDVLRFLHVSDPVAVKAELVVVRTSPFNVARAGGGERAGAAEGGARLTPLSPVMMEAIAEGSEFEFELDVDVATLRLLATGASPQARRFDAWPWIERLFGVTRDEAAALAPDALADRVLSAVEVSLAARMQSHVARDRRWLDAVQAAPGGALRRFVDDLAHDGTKDHANGGAAADAGVPLHIGAGIGLHGITVLAALESHASLAGPLARIVARAGLGLTPQERRERLDRERQRAAKDGDAGAPAGAEPLRDPRQLPVARRLIMEGGMPGSFLGLAMLRRGPIAESPRIVVDVRKGAAGPGDAAGTASERGFERRGPPRREMRPAGKGGKPGGGRPERGPGGEKRFDRRPEKRPEKRPPLPDRPATQTELDDLLKRFGPRH